MNRLLANKVWLDQEILEEAKEVFGDGSKEEIGDGMVPQTWKILEGRK